MDKIVILGGGESGVGCAILAKKQNFEVFLSDNGSISEKYIAMLNEHQIEFEQGGHTPEKLIDCTICVKSPGIPETAPMVVAIREKGVAIISEIEFAGRYTDAKIIGITGANGKTTTAMLTYSILKDAGYNVALVGNIGNSFALMVATEKYDWYVIELSSFQLDGMYEFKCDIAVLTNITPDHLDRYEYSLDKYAESKLRIVQNMTSADTFIYCLDDTQTMKRIMDKSQSFTMNSLPITVVDTLILGGSLTESGNIDINLEDIEMVIEKSKVSLIGMHNVYNIMASSLAAITAGVDPEKIKESVYNFKGVEHRTEPVCEKDGVLYINDSKATNVASTLYALEAMERPTVWIAGGTDKGNDYSALFKLAAQKVRTLVCMGKDNTKLVEAFTGIVPFIYSTSSLEECINVVKTVSKSGDCVLLSPACASFDLFKNYENRGELFKEAVLNIAPKSRD